MISGWGSIEFAGGPTDVLQKAELSVVTNIICSKNYKNLSTRQLCTRGSGRDSCQVRPITSKTELSDGFCNIVK